MAETLVSIPTQPTQIVQFAAHFVLSYKRSTGRNTSGSVLASAIREEFPDLPPHRFSRRWLAEIVKAAEADDLLVRNRDVQHLELEPGSAAEKLEATKTILTARPFQRHIRSEIWRAFTLTDSDEIHFLDRDTKQLITVTASDESAVSRYGDNPQYERIQPIPAKDQQRWMHDFLSANKLDTTEAPVHQDIWWVKFPEWLREQKPSLEQDWRRTRGRLMFAVIRDWAREVGVDFRVLSRSRPALEVASESLPSAGSTVENPIERKAIISAVADMTMEELKDLKIPVRYILRYFKIR